MIDCYFGTKPYPPARTKASVNDDKLPQSRRARARPRESHGKLGAPSISSSIVNQPTFLSANFLPAESVAAASSAAEPFVTCEFPECIAVIPWFGYVCYDNDEKKTVCRMQNRPTPSIDGICQELEMKTTECIAGSVYTSAS